MESIEFGYFLAQIMAVGAFAVGILSQQFKSKKSVFGLLALSNFLNAGHFYLLQANAGMVLAIIGTIRFWGAIYTKSFFILLAFQIINALAIVVTFSGWALSGTAYFAASLIIASGFTDSDHLTRSLLFWGGIGWMLYGVQIGSIVAILSNAFFCASVAIGRLRFRNDKVSTVPCFTSSR